MNRFLVTKTLVILGLLIAIGAAANWARTKWRKHATPAEQTEAAPAENAGPTDKVIVGDQAQKNLGLTAKQLEAGVFWKTISVPGMIVDRPGFTDREVAAPVAGSITRLFHVPGDLVHPGDELFTLRLASEVLQQTQ